MRLSRNWRMVLKKAWSVRLLVIAALLSGIEAALPLFADRFPRGPFAIASFLAVASAFVARLVAQKDFADED